MRFWKGHKKEARDNDASLEEIRNKGVMVLLADYQRQVAELRAELMAQAIRHSKEMKEAEVEREKILLELYTVRAQLDEFRKRLDGE